VLSETGSVELQGKDDCGLKQGYDMENCKNKSDLVCGSHAYTHLSASYSSKSMISFTNRHWSAFFIHLHSFTQQIFIKSVLNQII
jgi:hypothetical protein